MTNEERRALNVKLLEEFYQYGMSSIEEGFSDDTISSSFFLDACMETFLDMKEEEEVIDTDRSE